MKIKMKTISAGPTGNFCIGSVRDIPAEEAKKLIEGGFAELIEEKKTTEDPEIKKQPPVKTDKKDKVKKDGK